MTTQERQKKWTHRPIDPFYNTGTITRPEYFFGREKEKKDILLLIASGHSCINIWGPRKIGKSSLLYHLYQSGTILETLANCGCKPLVTYLDCQSVPDISPLKFWRLLRQRLAEDSDKSRGDIEQYLPENLEGYGAFSDGIKRLAANGFGIWFLLDEPERFLSNIRFSGGFFDTLRALLNIPMGVGSVGMVITTYRKAKELSSSEGKLTSPFWNVFVSKPIGLFTRDQTKEMLNTLLGQVDFPFKGSEKDRIVDGIIQIAGPHPFFAQRAGSTLLAMIRSGLFEGTSTDKLLQRVNEELNEVMYDVYETCCEPIIGSERETALISLLKSGKEPNLETLRELERMCLVIVENDKIDFFSESFKSFFQNRFIASEATVQHWQEVWKNLDNKQRALLINVYLFGNIPDELTEQGNYLKRMGNVDSRPNGYVLTPKAFEIVVGEEIHNLGSLKELKELYHDVT